LPLLPTQGVAIIDLGGVTRADSAALALIIEWRRLATQRALTLELRGLPAQLRALAAASGLEALCA
jgi:phospholipid transport system transporter-binding protein